MKKALVVCMTLFLLACQPTPEKEIIVSHDQKNAGTAAQGEPGAALTFPNRWEETMEVAGRKVIFEADVSLDATEQHPVFRVQRDGFSGDAYLKILEAAYGKCDWRENVMSREDILYEIEHIQIGIVDRYDYATQEYISTPFEDEADRIAPLIEMLQGITEDRFVPLTASRLNSLTEGKNEGGGVIRLENGELVYIHKQINPESISFHKSRCGMIQPERWVLDGEAIVSEPSHALTDISITEEEAIKVGEAFLEKLERSDLRLSYVEKARMLKDALAHREGGIAEGYYLHFAQAPSGCLPNGYRYWNAERMLQYDDLEDSFGARWSQETLDIFVTEDGILSVFWTNPMKIVGVIQEDSNLLSFDQVQERVRTLIEYGVKGSTYLGSSDGNIHVEEMVLSAVLRPLKDDPEHAELEPAWIIRMETDLSIRTYLDPYFLVIDATDGSLIR